MLVVMCGCAGLAGAAEAAEEKEAAALLYRRFPDRFLEHFRRLTEREMGRERELLDLAPEGAVDLSLGTFQALWNLGVMQDTGFELELAAIPLPQEVIEVCEALELNPYRIPGVGYAALREEAPAPGEVLLGYTKPGTARTVKTREGIRYLTKPEREY